MGKKDKDAGHIGLRLLLEAPGMNTQISSMANSAARMASKAFSIVGTAMGIATTGSFVKQCINAGSDLAEVQNVVDNSFKTMKDSVNSFAKDAIKNFGLSETVAKQYMGTIGAMNNAFGFTERQSYDMAEAVTGLTGDVASFYNLQSDEAFNKLKGIWTGETEALKSLGVVMTQTALDEYALNNGLGKTTAKMTEQEKVMLRFQYVTSALNTASGDFIRTQDGWANQTRILSLRFESLKAALGQGFINLFTPIIKSVNTLIASLQVLAEQFSKVTAAIMGKSYTTGISSITTESIEAAESVGAIGDAAVSSAKKATKALAGFDMLNNLTSSDSGSAGSTSGGVTSTIVPGNTEESAEEMTELSKAAQNFQKIIEDIKNIAGDFNIGDFFRVGADVSQLTDDIFNMASEAIDNVNWSGIGNKIGDFLRGLDWNKMLSAVGKFIWSGIDAGIELYAGMFDVAQIETKILSALAFLKLMGIDLTGTTIQVVGVTIAFEGLRIKSEKIWEQVSNKQELEDASRKVLGEFWGTLYANAVELFGGEYSLSEIIGALFEKDTWMDVVDTWKVGLDPSLENFVDFIMKCWNGLQDTFIKDLQDLIQNDIKPAFTTELWSGIYNGVKTAYIDKFEKVREWWNNTWLVKIWNKAKSFFNYERWKTTFDGVRQAFVDKWKQAIDSIKNLWNNFASWMNSKSTITIGGTKTQLLNIPQFATGGIIDTPTLAMVGEAGKEAVMPLENNTGWITKLADEISRRGGGGNAEYMNILMQILSVLLDILDKDTGISKDEVFRSVRSSVKQYKRENATLPW